MPQSSMLDDSVEDQIDKLPLKTKRVIASNEHTVNEIKDMSNVLEYLNGTDGMFEKKTIFTSHCSRTTAADGNFRSAIKRKSFKNSDDYFTAMPNGAANGNGTENQFRKKPFSELHLSSVRNSRDHRRLDSILHKRGRLTWGRSSDKFSDGGNKRYLKGINESPLDMLQSSSLPALKTPLYESSPAIGSRFPLDIPESSYGFKRSFTTSSTAVRSNRCNRTLLPRCPKTADRNFRVNVDNSKETAASLFASMNRLEIQKNRKRSSSDSDNALDERLKFTGNKLDRSLKLRTSKKLRSLHHPSSSCSPKKKMIDGKGGESFSAKCKPDTSTSEDISSSKEFEKNSPETNSSKTAEWKELPVVLVREQFTEDNNTSRKSACTQSIDAVQDESSDSLKQPMRTLDKICAGEQLTSFELNAKELELVSEFWTAKLETIVENQRRYDSGNAVAATVAGNNNRGMAATNAILCAVRTVLFFGTVWSSMTLLFTVFPGLAEYLTSLVDNTSLFDF